MYKNKHTDTYCTGNGRKMTTAETVQEIVKWLGSTRIWVCMKLCLFRHCVKITWQRRALEKEIKTVPQTPMLCPYAMLGLCHWSMTTSAEHLPLGWYIAVQLYSEVLLFARTILVHNCGEICFSIIFFPLTTFKNTSCSNSTVKFITKITAQQNHYQSVNHHATHL